MDLDNNKEKEKKSTFRIIVDIILGAIVLVKILIERFLGILLIAISFSLFTQELMNVYFYDKPKDPYLMIFAIFVLLTGAIIVVTQYLERMFQMLKEMENKYLILMRIIPPTDNINQIKVKEIKQSETNIKENKE